MNEPLLTLIHKDGQNHGPYSLKEINEMIRTGVLTPDDLGWQEGRTDWFAIRIFLPIAMPPAEKLEAGRQPGLRVVAPVAMPSSEKHEAGASEELRRAIARAFCVVGGWSSPITDDKLQDINMALSRCSAFKKIGPADRAAFLANADAIIKREGQDGLGDVNKTIGSEHGQQMVKIMMELVLSWDSNADKKKQLMWHIPPDMGLSMDAYYKMWDQVAASPPVTFANPRKAPPPLSASRSQSPSPPKNGRQKNEVGLLMQYGDEIETLKGQLAGSDPRTVKHLQRQIEQKMQVFWKQIALIKTEFPDAVEGLIGESMYYYFQAAILVLSKGALRRFAQGSAPLAMRVAAGAFAKLGESSEPARAMQLIDKSLEIFDHTEARYFKAHMLLDQGNKAGALAELNHIISKFPDDELYLSARKTKDEIENPPKKGCFIATAAYGSALASEVVILSRFRDEVLLQTRGGALFVAFYYRVSPPLASLIARFGILRAATRKLFLAPLLRLMKRATHHEIHKGK